MARLTAGWAGRPGIWRGLLAWPAVAPFALWALLRLVPGDVGFRWVQLVAFTPYVALASVVAPLVAPPSAAAVSAAAPSPSPPAAPSAPFDAVPAITRGSAAGSSNAQRRLQTCIIAGGTGRGADI